MKKILAFLVAAVIFTFLTACSSSTPGQGHAARPVVAVGSLNKEAPVSWNGTWKAEGMSAVISDNLITISIVDKDTSSLYWQGDWDSSKPATDGTDMVSIGDVAAMNASMLGSQDDKKAFSFEDDELKFSFSMMGTTKLIRLKK